MKAYPLIYSRTKNEDFVPDFLTRPADLDLEIALNYVRDAMKSLDTIDDIRYSTFVVGDYYIYGGISCITVLLLNKVKSEISMTSEMAENVEEYLNDCQGRKIAAFVGFAIRKDDLRSGKIPDLNYADYWDVYLEYLKKQWLENKTESEKIDFPPLELNEKTYNSLHKPNVMAIGEKFVVTDFNDNPQATVDYFFNQIINNSEENSFISNVKRRDDWDCMTFKYAHVFDDLLVCLKANPTSQTQERVDYIGGSSSYIAESETTTTNSRFREYKIMSASNGNKSSRMNDKCANKGVSNSSIASNEDAFLSKIGKSAIVENNFFKGFFAGEQLISYSIKKIDNEKLYLEVLSYIPQLEEIKKRIININISFEKSEITIQFRKR